MNAFGARRPVRNDIRELRRAGRVVAERPGGGAGRFAPDDHLDRKGRYGASLAAGGARSRGTSESLSRRCSVLRIRRQPWWSTSPVLLGLAARAAPGPGRARQGLFSFLVLARSPYWAGSTSCAACAETGATSIGSASTPWRRRSPAWRRSRWSSPCASGSGRTAATEAVRAARCGCGRQLRAFRRAAPLAELNAMRRAWRRPRSRPARCRPR